MITPGEPIPYSPPPEHEPLTFWEAWIKALFQPSEATYHRIAYAADASFWRASIWIFLASLVGLLISVPIQLALGGPQLSQLQEMIGDQTSALMGALGLMACLVPLGAFFSVIGAIIGAGIYQFIAGLMGGEGNFNATFNAFASFSAPLGIISYIAGSIPVVGLCVTIPLSIYGIILSVIAIQAVNRFGYAKAIITMLIPTIVMFACVCGLAFMLSAALGPAIGDVFQSIEQAILTPMP